MCSHRRKLPSLPPINLRYPLPRRCPLPARNGLIRLLSQATPPSGAGLNEWSAAGHDTNASGPNQVLPTQKDGTVVVHLVLDALLEIDQAGFRGVVFVCLGVTPSLSCPVQSSTDPSLKVSQI
jgi:hypothetical protein